MPGSLDSSAARSSIAPTLKRELEGKIQPAGELPHLSLCQFSRLFLRLIDGDEDEILQLLDILGIGNSGIDLDAGDSSLSVGFDRHHSATSRSCDGLLLQLGLHLLHARLHLLRLLEDLAEVGHWGRESVMS